MTNDQIRAVAALINTHSKYADVGNSNLRIDIANRAILWTDAETEEVCVNYFHFDGDGNACIDPMPSMTFENVGWLLAKR